MTDTLIYALAGIGALWVAVLSGRCVAWWREQRRQDRLAEKLAALRFSEISPADAMWARKHWPVNVDRAERIATGRHTP